MNRPETLTPRQAAELLNYVREVPRNHLIRRKASKDLLRSMCHRGELQDMGVEVEERVTGYHINRLMLLRAVWDIAGQMAAQAAVEMGMSAEDFVAGARPMYEQVLAARQGD